MKRSWRFRKISACAGFHSRSWTRAAELVALVEEAVGEVERAVKHAPAPPARPSQSEPDLEVFGCFAEACAKALTEEAPPS